MICADCPNLKIETDTMNVLSLPDSSTHKIYITCTNYESCARAYKLGMEKQS